ncbi:MAG: LuxR C-terminal-related transcriptional regulator, partial [Candidatus Baltobacteraceae bacterium]
AGLRFWTSPEMLRLALESELPEVAAAATLACLAGTRDSPPLEPQLALALRRALVQTDGAANAIELFSMAARYGEPDEARLAVNALRAVFAPKRRYLHAHYLLARAHLLFRFGEGPVWIDHAGDAARAFNEIGMRRWTDDAMLLLVRQEGGSDRPQRRRRPTTTSLTGREQQVAQLIRRGARNREVAMALQISEHTVERHVSSILGRLGIRSRWQIVDAKKGNEH